MRDGTAFAASGVCDAGCERRKSAEHTASGRTVSWNSDGALFAFLLSRECYQSKRRLLLDEQKLKYEVIEAERDPMTKLLNRRGLERSVNAAWNSRMKNEEVVAGMMIDIDHFKQYNDHFGHVQGDFCICSVAQSIAATVRGLATVARVGGEEFFIFVRGLREEEVLAMAEAVRANVENMHITHGSSRTSVITVSVGVDIQYANEDVSFPGLYGRADRQLYAAKREGRNRVESSSSVYKKYHRIG